MPTDERIRQAGGFQTPSSPSTIESRGQGVVGIKSGLISSAIGNMEPCAEFVLSKGLSASPLDHPSVPIEPKDELGGHNLPKHAVNISAESSLEPPKETDRILPHLDQEWISEASRTEAATAQAKEFKRQVDAAYNRQIRALRTYNWISNTYASGSIFTPPGQIKSSGVDFREIGNGGEVSAFSDFSTPETPCERGVPNNGGREEDPFNTPPNRSPPSPRSTPKSLLPRSLMPDGALVRVKKRRDRQLSPCAYRGRKEADLLFNALQHEVSVNQQPLRRSQEPETELEHLDRLFNTANIDDTSHSMASHLGISKNSGFEDLIDGFDARTDSILANVKGGNDGFTKDADALLGRRRKV
jgi:hypothetical protein